MRTTLLLLLSLIFIGIYPDQALGQQCSTPTVTLPADKSYCGPQTISFSTTNSDHTPTYTANAGGSIASYTWTVNGVVIATAQYPTINFPKADIYTVTVTATKTCGESSSDTQVIVVEDVPQAPDVQDVYTCTGSNATLWVNNPNPNLRYRWYDNNNNLLAWGTSYTRANAINGTYQIEAVTPGGCLSPRTTASIYTTSPNGNASLISSDQTICANVRPNILDGNAPQNMTFQWFISTTGSSTDFYPITSARDRQYHPPVLSQTSWFKRVAYRNGCGEESNVVKITVIPVPANPIVENTIICAGTRATLTVLNASPTAVYDWYTAASGGNFVGTGPTLTTPDVLWASRKYYVSASTTNNSNCNTTTPRTEVDVVVTPGITNNTITNNQDICVGGTAASLIGSTPTGGGEGYIYQWQRSTDGASFTDIPGANAKDFSPGRLTTTTWYRRKVKGASPCPEVTSNSVRITVTPLPVSIDVDDPYTCAGSSATITIRNSNDNYTYSWYDVATGGTLLSTGTTYKTTPLSSDRTYYIEVTTSAGCISTRRPVTVTVTPVPGKPVAADATTCAGTSATLSVNPTNAALFYRWYDAPTGGTHLGTGNEYTTIPLSSDKTFYVEAVTYALPGCISPRETVQVTVIPAITNTLTSPDQNICSGQTPNPLTGPIPTGGGGNYTYQWQQSEDGTFYTDITGATGRDYAPGMLTTTTWYRRKVSTTSGTCPAVFSSAVEVSVTTLPTVPAIANTTICTGSQATLQIPYPDANFTYKWYTVPTGGIAIAEGTTTYTTEPLTSNKTYYVEAVTENGCISASRRPATVTVEELPPVPVTNNMTICAGSKPTLQVVSPDADLEYQWFDAPTGGALLTTGTYYNVPNPLSRSTTFYVQAVNDAGCASPSRAAVQVTVVALPAIPYVPNATICSGNSTTLYVNNPNPEFNYRWYSGSTLLATGTSFTTGNLTASVTYHVDAVTKGETACASSGSRPVTVNVIPPIIYNNITTSQTAVCSGSTAAALTGMTPTGGSAPLTYQWEKSENGVNFIAIGGATNPTYSPGILTTTTWFRRVVRGTDSCPPNPSNIIQITVNPLPASPVADGKTICRGASTTLQVNTPSSDITYKWYNAATGGSVLGSLPSFTTEPLEASTVFYVEATNNATGCVSPRKPVTVTVRELPEMPMAENKMICFGQNTTLTVTTQSSSLIYKWYNASGTLLSSQPSLSVNNLEATTTYYLEATYVSEPACSSPRREVTVTVVPLPALPAVEGITVCSGSKGILQVKNLDPDLTYKWYATATGGSPIGNLPTFETHALTSDRTYYVEAVTSTGCLSGRTPVAVRVTALPATPQAVNASICSSSTALLTVSNADNTLTYQWYESNTSTTPLATGETFLTSVLQSSTTYYVEAITASGCVSPSRRAVSVDVTPLPATPSAEDRTICAGGETILSVDSPNPSLLYKWYNAEGVHLATGISYNTGILHENKTYYLEAVTNTTLACASAERKLVTVTVTPVIANNTISESQTICSGTAPATLTGSNPTGGGGDYIYQWQQSNDGTNFTNISGATAQHYTPGTISTRTWYRRRVSTPGTCSPSFSAPVQISTVTPPGTPLVNNTTICAGTTATLVVTNTSANTTYRWYNVATGGSVLNIDDTFQTPELSTTTTFYVEAVNNNGCMSPRRAVTVHVTAVPDAPIVPARYICEGQTATLTVSSPVQNLIYTWYDHAGTVVGSGTSYTTPAPLTSNTIFYVEATTTTNPACTSERTAVAVTVMSQPAIPVTENVTICAGSSARLSVRVIDAAITYKWYTVPAGGTPVAESPSYTTTALTSNRTYYVEAVNIAGCTSARATVVVDVMPLPDAPFAEGASICAGATATLYVNNPDNNLVYKWYDAAEGGNLLITGTQYTTHPLQNSTTFYLSAETPNGCASTTRTPVTVTVTPLPATPEVSNATICSDSDITLWVTNQTPGMIYHWYTQTGVHLATGTSYTTERLNTTSTYLVEAVTNTTTACASSPRRTVVVTVVAPISNNSISGVGTVCTGTVPATITGTVPGGGAGSYTYQWERSTDGINFTAITGAVTQNHTPTSAITTDTWYRRKVSATGGPCAEHISEALKITVTPAPAAPTASGATICAGTMATLQVTNPDPALTYRWFATATGGNPLHAQATFVTNELSTTTTFYVEAINATGCVSSRRAVTATVRPLPEPPVVSARTICSGQTTTLAVTAPNATLNYKWYTADGTLVATGTSYITPALEENTTYFIEASTVGSPICTSSSRTSVTVEVTPLPQAPVAEDVTVCAGNAAELQVSIIAPDLTYKWYTVATGGTPVATSSSYTTPVLTSGRTYYVAAETENGCAGARTMVRVHVTQQPDQPIVSGTTICAGQSATVSVENPDDDLVYNWYDAATDGTLLAMGNSYSTGTLRSTTTFYVEARTADGCASTPRSAVTVTITPLPATPDADNATICAGGNVTLWVKNPLGGISYRWYEGDVLRATGLSYTTNNLNATTTYYLEAVTNNSNACVSAARKTVLVTVIPAITNNSISSEQTICAGESPARLLGSTPAGGGSNYAYQWEQSADGTNFAAISGATSQNYAPTALTSDTWYRRRVSTPGTCPESISNLVKVTVVSPAPTPFVSAVAICAGTTATLQVSNSDNSLAYRWYESATDNNSIGSSASFTTRELTETTTFYVEAVNATGCASPRRAVTVTVRQLPEMPVVADKAICHGQTTTLAVASPVAGLNYKWYNANDELLATGASFTTPSLDRTTVFYVEASYVNYPECSSSPRTMVTVSVTPLPQAPVAASAAICSGSSAILSVSVIDANLTYRWFTTPTGGTAIATGTSYTTPALTSGRTYYVEAATALGCASPRTLVAVNVTQLPAIPLADNLEVCAGTTAALTVNNPASGLTYNWYDAATDGQLLATGDSYTIASIAASKTVYLEAVTETGCASPSRKAVEVNVTPLPLTPQVNNTTVCAGQSATLSVVAAEAGLLYKWYDLHGAHIFTGTTFTSGNLQENTVFFVEAVTNSSTACASSPRRTVHVTVTPAIANNVISEEQTICSGSTATLLNGSTPTGGEGSYTYQWERSTDGINFHTIQGATERNYAPGALTTDTWYRRRVSAAGTCSPNASNIVRISVTPQPSVPLAQGVTACQNGEVTLSISNVNTALTYHWYSTASGGNSIGTGQSFTVADIEATTTFYVEAMNSSGCTSSRRAVLVTVIPKPEAPLATSREVCYGQTATLYVTSPVPSQVYRWYNSNGELVGTGTTFITEALQMSSTFYIETSTTTNPACVSDRNPVSVTVTSLPALPRVQNVSTCSGSSATLAVSTPDPAFVYKWYTSATGGTAVATGTSITTSVLTTSRNYYVEAETVSGCRSGRVMATVEVVQLPSTPLAENVSICAGATATLSVTDADDNLIYKWYDAATDGNLLATGSIYNTGSLNASTTLYVAAETTTGCASTARRPVTVSVTPLPAVPEVENTTVCAGGSVTLWVQNPEPGLSYRWYEGGLLLTTGLSYTADNLAASTIYHIEAVSNSATACVSSSRKAVTVTVVPAIANNRISADQTVCNGSTPARITGSMPSGGGGNYTYQWERSDDGINFTAIAAATSPDYTPAIVYTTTWFRRRVTATGPCAESYSNVIRVSVVPLPATPLSDNTTICAGSSATLSVKDANPDMAYRWYNVATGGSTLAMGTSFATSALETNTTYFVEAVNANGCVSPRRAVQVYVTPLPALPQVADKTICAGERTTLAVISPEVSVTYRWYDANGTMLANGTSYTTGILTQNSVFYIEATTTTATACTSQRKAVMVQVTQLPELPEAEDVTICEGASATLAVKQPNPNLTYKWYNSATGGTAIAAGVSYTTTALTSGRTYYVEAATASGCVGARKAVEVTVTPLPTTPIAKNKVICAGGTATLAVEEPNIDHEYRWYNAPSGGSLLATGISYTVPNLKVSTTYYIEAVTAEGCASTSRKAVVITVMPLPATPAAENAAVCAGERATLWVKNPDPALEYRWYSDAGGINLIGTGISYTSDNLFSSTSYYVEALNATGCASSAKKQVDVKVTHAPGIPTVENQVICAGSSTRLTVTSPDPAAVYKWFDENGNLLHTGTTYTTTTLTANRTYYVSASTAATTNCASARLAVTVRVIAPVTANTISGEQTICSNGTPARITGSLPTGGGDVYTYQWEFSEDGTNFTSIVGGNAQDYTPGTLAKTTWFRRKVKSAGPCAESVSNAVKVTATPLPAMPLADDVTTCAGTSTTLTVKNAVAALTYRWYDTPAGGTMLGSGITFETEELSGNTVYYLEATNTAGCTSSTRRAVTVIVTSSVSNNTIGTDQTVCYEEVPARITGSIPGSATSFTYQWQRSEDGGRFTDIQGANGQHYAPAAGFTRTTWFRRKVTTNGPCPEHYSNTVKIEVVALPTVPAIASISICPGERATFQAAATMLTGESLEWYDAAVGGRLLHIGTSYTTPALTSTTSYYVQAVNQASCGSSERREVKATVVVPKADAGEDQKIMAGKKVQLNATGGKSYSWSPVDGLSDPTSATPVASPAVTTTYTVTITTAEGCTATDEVTIEVTPGIEAVNFITPNGDGFNDYFEIKNIELYPDCHVEIFTRWGEKVFESKGYTEPWNGLQSGKPLPTAAYYYIIRLGDNVAPISGSITIIK